MPTDAVSLQDRSILVCDVDETILDLLTDVFSDEGASVTQAHGGQNALTLLRNGWFDLIVQALVMPDVDGWDVLGYLRSRRPDLVNRLVLMTGYTYDPFTVHRIERLHLPALYKPFDLDELRGTVHQTLHAAERTQRRTAA
jgi:two-component system response regulator HydG